MHFIFCKLGSEITSSFTLATFTIKMAECSVRVEVKQSRIPKGESQRSTPVLFIHPESRLAVNSVNLQSQ